VQQTYVNYGNYTCMTMDSYLHNEHWFWARCEPEIRALWTKTRKTWTWTPTGCTSIYHWGKVHYTSFRGTDVIIQHRITTDLLSNNWFNSHFLGWP